MFRISDPADFTQELNSVFKSGIGTDCTLIGYDGKLRCHTSILVASSRLFCSLLEDTGADGDSVIIYPDSALNDLNLMLELMTTGLAHCFNEKDVLTTKVTELKKLTGWTSLSIVDENRRDSKQDKSVIKYVFEEVEDLQTYLNREKVQIVSKLKQSNVPDYVISPSYEEQYCEELAVNKVPVVETAQPPKYKEYLCSRNCSSKCDKIFNQLEDKDKVKIRQLFAGERIIDVKKQLLAHLHSQDNCGHPGAGFYLANHLFCTNYLSALCNISKYILKSVLSDFWTGRRFYQHGNEGLIKSKFATGVMIAWVKQFCEHYGQFAPDENVIILPYWLYKRVLYDIYVDETIGPHVSLSAFYELFKKYFGPHRVDLNNPHVRISKYSSHSVCNICVALNTMKRQAKTEFELRVAQDKINHHRLIFGGARRKIDEIIQSALEYPSDNLG